MNSTHAYFNISAREIGAKLKPHGSVCPPLLDTHGRVVWRPSSLFWSRHRFQIASFSPSTLENSVFEKHRFQITPLWRAFLNGSVFGDHFRRCSVDDSRIRSKNSAFFVWKRISVDGALVTPILALEFFASKILLSPVIFQSFVKPPRTLCLTVLLINYSIAHQEIPFILKNFFLLCV